MSLAKELYKMMVEERCVRLTKVRNAQHWSTGALAEGLPLNINNRIGCRPRIKR
jgi:hypothetical protein